MKNKLNISFFVLSISASFWLGSSGIGESLLWVKISYLSAILSCIGFFYFAQYFPFQKYKVTKYIHL
ncbi:hypothetical protein KJ810_00785, partial [Patescibacteria group bacterium]|nr:hypothetical protein [Patescibacteria group bacterium]